ncbi:MAG: glycosyltransferase family 4 protein [Alphaproteobacteria bacterium]|nr:glycosyltransferase family 4 protein [Alphaproteobacteria bacterium]
MTPRVLVIGFDLPHTGSAGSIVLYRLLSDWPEDRILAIGPPPPPGSKRLDCKFVEFNPSFERLNATRFRKALLLARLSHLISTGHVPVGGFRADIVLSVMSNLSHAMAATAVAKRENIPLVWIVHDDPEEFNKTYNVGDALARRKFREMYRAGASRLCVSSELESTLSSRYGAPGLTMYPLRSETLKARSPTQNANLKNREYLTIGYAGALSYGYGPRLIEMAPLLRSAKAKVIIYGSSLETAECSDVLISHGRLPTPEEAWERIKAECDAVLLPYCYANHGHASLLQTHFPSKLVEYLALGMPVVVTGPDYATGVKWAQRNQDCCVLVTEQDGRELVEALTQLREKPELRVRLGERAIIAGTKEFDPRSIKTAFARHLRQVTKGEATCLSKVCE